jgi:UDP-glucose 4-epimerase
MKAVVTGGAGFVGSNVVHELVGQGHDVIVVDDFFTGKPDNVPDVEIVEGCVTNYRLMRKVCRRADYVFHLACRNIIVSTQNPADDFRVNAGGTFQTLLAARDSNVKHVVYASSCSVYGDQARLPIREDDPVRPLTPYAASKHSGEAYCHAFYASYGLASTVVRYSNVYGPGQRPDNPYCGVVSRFLDDSMNGRPMRVFGGGQQTRDYTYVTDIVAATLLASQTTGTYNVATETETSVNELAALVGGPVEHVGLRDIDNVSRRALSIEKIGSELNWYPKVGLAEGIELTRKWLTSSRF